MMKTKIDFTQASFIQSGANMRYLPPDVGIEVAFAGRSNAGKSSALNTITGQKGLARTSKTPGRTQLINFFGLDEARRLVDLPGYGYAKVSAAQKQQWQALIDAYLRHRDSLVGLVLIMDARHPLKPFDLSVLEWAATCDLPIHILLTKSDKLSHSAQQATLKQVQQAVSDLQVTVQLFSSLKKTGVEACRTQLCTWLAGDAEISR